MKITPYISVPNARETIKSYEKLFGAKLLSHMPFDENVGKEMGLPDSFDYEKSTMHAVLEFSGTEVFISDSMGPSSPGPVEIVLDFDNRKELELVWGRVKRMGLEVVMELEEQFWGALYGRFRDKNNVGWQLNYTIKQE